MEPHEECACLTAAEVETGLALGSLGAVRAQCAVLSDVVLPESVWPDFQEWHRNPDSVGCHRSISLLAFERGFLSRVTSPIHRYLMEGGHIRPEVTQQYLKDLRERWMQYPSPGERHQKSKMFRGRLMELQFAEWLGLRGTPITGLEALGARSDIESKAIDGSATAFEVKFIGGEDSDFELLLQAIAGGPAVAAISPYAPVNYLLFRAYEAAKQLGSTPGIRVATVIVDESTWWRFETQLEHGWIDWANPKFIGDDTGWNSFIERQRAHWPDLPGDLSSTLRQVDALWIVRQSFSFEFNVVSEMTMRSA